MIKVIISGCNGKMGTVISKLALNDEDVKVVAGFDINTTKNFDYEVFENPADYKEKADVIIDFSHPSMFEKIIGYAVETSTPVVVATTGLSDEQKESLNKVSEKTGVFFSANMSIGINLLMELCKKASETLGLAFDVEIIEKHHNKKLDAPSGTALMIADAIASEREESEYVYDRHSVRKARESKEIGIHAIRGGTIVGEHEAIFAGENEIVTISHSAASREIFATGALRAAVYLAKKDNGLYNMTDMIEGK